MEGQGSRAWLQCLLHRSRLTFPRWVTAGNAASPTHRPTTPFPKRFLQTKPPLNDDDDSFNYYYNSENDMPESVKAKARFKVAGSKRNKNADQGRRVHDSPKRGTGSICNSPPLLDLAVEYGACAWRLADPRCPRSLSSRALSVRAKEFFALTRVHVCMFAVAVPSQ